MCSFQLLNAYKYTGLLGIHLSFFFVPRCAFNSNADHRLYSMKRLNPRLVQTYRGSQSPTRREGRTEPSFQDSPGHHAPTCVRLPSVHAFCHAQACICSGSYSYSHLGVGAASASWYLAPSPTQLESLIQLRSQFDQLFMKPQASWSCSCFNLTHYFRFLRIQRTLALYFLKKNSIHVVTSFHCASPVPPQGPHLDSRDS